MWQGGPMSFGESLMISGMGMLVVLMELALLAVAIIIFSKILSSFQRKAKTEDVSVPGGSAEDELAEDCAVVIAAVCEDMKVHPDQIRIREIKRVE